MKLTLVVMAAGLGSRYGGLKQIEPVGPNGEMIMEYSIYDAMRAGFDKVVFVVKRENIHAFKERIGFKVETMVDASYVYQDIEAIPTGLAIPTGRIKPWGTGHAVLCCKDTVKTPFAVINADDFYGRASFQLLADELAVQKDEAQVYRYCMVGFKLINTVSEHGSVARGVCRVDAASNLIDIVERTHVEKHGAGARFTEDGQNWTPIDDGTIVSMNAWGFSPSVFTELEQRFRPFIIKNDQNLLTAEYFLPDVIGALLAENKARVRVLPTSERWYGVTYREDREAVTLAVGRMIDGGVYPSRLWGG